MMSLLRPLETSARKQHSKRIFLHPFISDSFLDSGSRFQFLTASKQNVTSVSREIRIRAEIRCPNIVIYYVRAPPTKSEQYGLDVPLCNCRNKFGDVEEIQLCSSMSSIDFILNFASYVLFDMVRFSIRLVFPI